MLTYILSHPIDVIVYSFFDFLCAPWWRIWICIIGESLSYEIVLCLSEDFSPESDILDIFFLGKPFQGTINQARFFFSETDSNGSE